MVVDGIVSGGTVRRASPAMVATYHEYLAEDYHRVPALAQTDLVLVQLVGERTGDALSTHGARQMIERAGRRAGLGLINPQALRHIERQLLPRRLVATPRPSPTRADG